MVFELLGGTFVLALIKIAGDETGMLGFADLLNTEKALSVILGALLGPLQGRRGACRGGPHLFPGDIPGSGVPNHAGERSFCP